MANTESSNTEVTRRYPRVKAPEGTLVGWQVGTKRSVSSLDDIALGGLFIRTPDPPPERSLVKLVLSTGTGAVRARGVVRRVAPSHGMAIEFTAMNPDDRGRLTGLLRPLLERQGTATDRPV
jgi:PilZ domain-containing protein